MKILKIKVNVTYCFLATISDYKFGGNLLVQVVLALMADFIDKEKLR